MACGDPGGAKCAGTWTASTPGVMALSESFFRASCSWRSEGLFGQSFSTAPLVRALRGLPCLGSFALVRQFRHLKGHPGWGASLELGASGVGWASLSIVQPPVLVCGRREAMVMVPPPTRDSTVSPCFQGCRLSSTGISCQNLPHIPLILLSAVNSSPHPGIAPQSLNSSSQPLRLPEDTHPCPGYVRLQ